MMTTIPEGCTVAEIVDHGDDIPLRTCFARRDTRLSGVVPFHVVAPASDSPTWDQFNTPSLVSVPASITVNIAAFSEVVRPPPAAFCVGVSHVAVTVAAWTRAGISNITINTINKYLFIFSPS
jgi:hypothetical protein